ncbi:putative UDP-glucuronic acid decarboxylase 2 [Cocos nucifera]|uniref:Putative UDP-glucuronic acid decarboxylase 2 n=1 Tax=Cocos nucifera TaxID=13894 RepID=A0A8K0IRH4_COCNU|nr:putative UDP-glucuronic acid decarboxylase 2 [Cocos nucifera]
MGLSELVYRGHESQPQPDGAYSPKPEKGWLAVPRLVRYLLREQRLLFVLLGVALATVLFSVPHLSFRHPPPLAGGIGGGATGLAHPHHHGGHLRLSERAATAGGKVPLALRRRGRRVVVTGGAGFVGSHLVDRLMARGDTVIVVDNFFTGRKENVMHHLGNPNFELIRHDVVEPLLLEVDQIYHLACPASPVHYKFNPVKTIISFNIPLFE